MATIVTRTGKGSALTFTEADDNFINLNNDGIANSSAISTLQTDKLDKAGGTVTGTLNVNGNLTLGSKLIGSSSNNSQSGAGITISGSTSEIIRLTSASLVSVSGIDSGVSGQKNILVNKTGVNVSILNNSSFALSLNRIFTGNGSDVTLPPDASISIIYDGSSSRWNVVGGTGTGGGSAGINYIVNTDASSGTVGWTTYADAAGAQPVDGSGGSPQPGLWVASSTIPLRGSADFNLVKTGTTSYQGNGVAYDFTIDNADLARVLTVSFDYEVVSGTYATGDLTVYLIQDPTGTPVVIQPAGFQVVAATAGTKMTQIATFQTDVAQKSYRLCFHVATPSIQDYTLALDNIVLGPNQKLIVGTGPVGQIISTGSITPPNGFLYCDGSAISRTVYSDLFSVISTTYGSGDGSTTFNLPDLRGVFLRGAGTQTISGINYSGTLGSKQGDQFQGHWHINDANANGGPENFGGGGNQGNGLNVTTYATTVTSDGVNGTPRIGTETRPANVSVAYHIKYLASFEMSSSTDTRVVAARADRNGVNQTIATNNTSVQVQINSLASTYAFDSHGAFNTSTYNYVAPLPGYYRVTGTVALQGTNVLSTQYTAQVKVDGVDCLQSSYTYPSAGTPFNLVVSGVVKLNAGQTVGLWFYGFGNNSVNTLTLLGNKEATNFQIERLSGPSQIAASETVAARYTNTAGTSVPTGGFGAGLVPVPFANRSYDSHGFFNGATGVGTIPIAGIYRISCSFYFSSQSWTGVGKAVAVRKNGTIVGFLALYTPASASTVDLGLVGTTEVRFNAGDTFDLNMWLNEASSRTLSTLAEANQLTISRIGN